MPDTGDPSRAAPIWVGTYQMTVEGGVTISNEWVMLSKQNMVQFMGDADGVTANQTFATLPEECRPDETVMLPVVVEGAGGIEQQISVTATGGSLSVPIPALSGSASVPEATASVEIPDMTGTSSFEVSSHVPDMVSVGYDESGVPNSAFSFGIINNSTEPIEAEVTVNGASATVDVPSATATVSTNPTTVTVDSPTIQATGTVTIPQTIGILSVSPAGELSCNLSGRVHLNGLNFHTCANYY